MLEVLDAASVRSWAGTAVALLAEHRAEIDALNVFPVPDSDTGANMLATLRGAEAALGGASGDVPADLLAVWADGAARGAVGNSGFILSQLLRGLADAAGAGPFGAAVLADGLRRGAELGRGAVVDPVEGTILTVARTAADAAAPAGPTATLHGTATSAYDAATEALAATTGQLDALRRAGIVDAGGRGLVVVLAALLQVVRGEPVPLADVAVPTGGHTHTLTFGFEVQYLLDAEQRAVEELRARLQALGDSVVVVRAGGGWKVHVHVDDVGAAIEAGVEAGRPHDIAVTELARSGRGRPAGSVAILAVAPGAGLAHLFQREGVHVVDSSASGQSPSVDDVTAAIRAAGARELVLLPNAARVTDVAQAAAEASRGAGVRVAVVPTRSPVQGLAAIAVHDATRAFDDDVVAMAEAAAATRWAEVVIARQEALTAVGICYPGDVLGLIDGEVVEIGRHVLAVAFGVVDRLLGVGGELMTVLVGEGAPPRTGVVVEEHVRGRAPLIDVAVYDGGQPDRPLVIGVE